MTKDLSGLGSSAKALRDFGYLAEDLLKGGFALQDLRSAALTVRRARADFISSFRSECGGGSSKQ